MAEKEDTTIVVGGSEGGSASSIKNHITNKRNLLWLGIVVVIVVIILGVIIHKTSVKNASVFVVGSTSYSKDDITEMAVYAIGPAAKKDKSRLNNFSKGVYEMYITEAASKVVNIMPASKELAEAQKNSTFLKPTTDVQKEYVRLTTYNNALSGSYDRYEKGISEGYKFVFDFSRRIIPPPIQESPVEGYNDKDQIKTDKDYAKIQAEKYLKEYKSGSINEDKLLKVIAADNKINFSNRSGYFGPKNKGPLSSQLSSLDIYKYVSTQTQTGISNLLIGKVPTKINPTKTDQADGFFYFIDLKKVGATVTNASLKVDAAKSKIEATYYGF